MLRTSQLRDEAKVKKSNSYWHFNHIF